MSFNERAPEWEAQGVEPTTELKENGFVAGYKPPADYFNYMFNRYSASIKDTQEQIENNIAFGRKEGTNSGEKSTALGHDVTASGEFSHAEGKSTIADGPYSHAEGCATYAMDMCSHAEGCDTEAGYCGHAEGKDTIAGYCSHAEGERTEACGMCSHAEGVGTKAENDFSHAEGNTTTARGMCSHAEGLCTIALDYQHAQGHFNNTLTALENSETGTSDGTAFVIGNGTEESPSNAFRVTGEGATIAKNAYSTTGADYAEFREWLDGNADNEDRRGYFVTLDGKKIRKANAGEYIRGVVSALPSVIGNYDEEWMGRYIRDEFGAFITETFEYTEKVVTSHDENGEPIIETVTKTGTRWKENPDYDKEKEYIPREKRKEWSAVGMLGELSVRDDGTCQVNGYCKCADGGIATHAEVSDYSYLTPIYRVVDRVTENIVKIEI